MYIPYLFLFLLFSKEVLCTTHGSTVEDWLQHKDRHELDFEEAEDLYRYELFKENIAKINEINSDPRSTFTAAPNFMTHWHKNEYRNLLGFDYRTAYINRHSRSHSNGTETRSVAPRTAPSSMDWRNSNVVTPVKNQGNCGSCWSFSATGAIEGINAIRHGTLTSLSEQKLIDCSGSYGNMGCNGGSMDAAFRYVKANGGDCTESSYPYTASQGTCRSSTSVSTVTGFVDVTANSETALLNAVAQQPVSVAIEADQAVFQFYSSGVLTGSCGTNLDHGVLVVGYGTDPSHGEYWLVKNSWGTNYGEAGYVRLAKGAAYNPHGQCGIQMMPSYPTA
jgi:C1A family cysteine protease